MFKEGQFITAAHAGIHQVIKVEPVFYESYQTIPYGKKVGDLNYNLIHYRKVLSSNGIPSNGAVNLCNELHCELATEYIKKEVAKINRILETIR